MAQLNVERIDDAYKRFRDAHHDLVATANDQERGVVVARRLREAVIFLIATMDTHWPAIKQRLEYEQ